MWRMHIATEAVNGLSEATSDLSSYLRRRHWRKKLTEDRSDTVTDPRVAATTMMTALIQSDGALMERELLEHYRWLVANVKDFDHGFLRLAPVNLEKCGPEPRTDLIEMLNAVAAHISDASSNDVGQSITRRRNRLI